MYLGFYGLGKEPFHITPDPEFLFLSPSHKEAYGAVLYGVAARKGFITLTGEVGTGKTTILRSYLRQIKNTEVRPIYLFNVNVTFRELLQLLLHEMGMDVPNRPEAWMLQWLHWHLIQEFRKGHNVALIVDEAQNMPVDTVEKLRMLSNIETSKDKLLQIVLVGQPELEQKLDLHELRQLRERIAVHAVLKPLGASDSEAYVRHRLHQAGGDCDRIFQKKSLHLIVRQGKGNPRRLNILCDNALIAGYGYRQRPVTAKIIREVVNDFEGKARPRISLPRPVWIGAAAVLAVLALLLGSATYWRQPTDSTTGGEAGNVAHAVAPAPPEPALPPVQQAAPRSTKYTRTPTTSQEILAEHAEIALKSMMKVVEIDKYSYLIPPDLADSGESAGDLPAREPAPQPAGGGRPDSGASSSATAPAPGGS